MLRSLVECTVSSGLERFDFQGIPLRKGCRPQLQYQDNVYTCQVMEDKGRIDIGKTGRLKLTLASDKSIPMKENDTFQLVTSGEKGLIILAQGKVVEKPKERLV